MDEIITSAKNPLIKQLRQLIKSPKHRNSLRTYVAEGAHLAEEFLQSSMGAELVVLSESAAQNHEIKTLGDKFKNLGVKSVIISDSLFESISDLHAKAGIMFVFGFKARELSSQPISKSVILLDRVQNPGNLGTIIRTASAVGVRDIFLSEDCSSPWSSKSLRAGKGAQFSLNIYENVDLFSVVKKSTIPVCAASLDVDSVSLFELNLRGEVAWIFGNEGEGVSPDLAKACDKKVIIPQADGAVESLNVSAATAVCLYEQFRQAKLIDGNS